MSRRSESLAQRYLQAARGRLSPTQSKVLHQILYDTSFKARRYRRGGKLTFDDIRTQTEDYPMRTLKALERRGYISLAGSSLFLTPKAIEEGQAKGWPDVVPVRDENYYLIDIRPR